MKYYHATSEYAFYKIINEGIKTGFDGIVYLADSKENALKFISFRLINEPIYVLEVELNENEVEETFDHSYKFFKCKAYGYAKNIPFNKITNAWMFPSIHIKNYIENNFIAENKLNVNNT